MGKTGAIVASSIGIVLILSGLVVYYFLVIKKEAPPIPPSNNSTIIGSIAMTPNPLPPVTVNTFTLQAISVVSGSNIVVVSDTQATTQMVPEEPYTSDEFASPSGTVSGVSTYPYLVADPTNTITQQWTFDQGSNYIYANDITIDGQLCPACLVYEISTDSLGLSCPEQENTIYLWQIYTNNGESFIQGLDGTGKPTGLYLTWNFNQYLTLSKTGSPFLMVS